MPEKVVTITPSECLDMIYKTADKVQCPGNVHRELDMAYKSLSKWIKGKQDEEASVVSANGNSETSMDTDTREDVGEQMAAASS